MWQIAEHNVYITWHFDTLYLKCLDMYVTVRTQMVSYYCTFHYTSVHMSDFLPFRMSYVVEIT